MKLKVAINGRFLNQRITGVQRYAREFVTTLDRLLATETIDPEKWDITLLHPPLNQSPIRLKKIARKQVGLLSGQLWEQLELPFYVLNNNLLCLGNSAPVLGLLASVPTIVVVHDLSHIYFPEAYAQAYRAMYWAITPAIMRCAKAIITVSKSENLAILQHYPRVENRIHAVQNGGLSEDMNPDLVMPDRLNLSLERPFILCVTSLSTRKNIQGILKTAEVVIRQRPVDFVLIGGTSQVFQKIKADLSIEVQPRIHFVGQIDDVNTLINFYKSALCLLFPSFYEASPLPPIEAMACGCPVVASNIPSLQERCGEAVLYCQPDNVEDIINTVLTVIDNPKIRSQLRAKGLQACKQFTWESCVRQTLSIIEQTISTR